LSFQHLPHSNGQQYNLQPWETLRVRMDVCAYEGILDLAPGAEDTFDVPLMVDAGYPDNGIDPLTLSSRVDGENETDGIFNTDRSSATAVDEATDPNDESIPDTSEDVALSSPEAEDAPPATVDAESGTVSIPVGFENTSDQPLENVVLSVQLSEGSTVPDDSSWTCDENGLCIQNVGTVESGESVSEPIAFVDDSVSPGDTVTLPTRLDAQQIAEDGTVTPISLRGTVETTVETPTAPSNSVDGRPISDVTADPEMDPSNPAASGITAEDISDPNLPENMNGTKDVTLAMDPNSPIFTRGEVFEFTGSIANTGQEPLTDAVARFVVPENTTLQSTENFTCQNGGVAGDVCAYAIGTVEAGAEATFEIPLMVAEDYPDNGIDPLSISGRIDAKNQTEGVFVAVRSEGGAVDSLPNLNDQSVPETSEDIVLSAPDAEDAEPATVNLSSGMVSVPVDYQNTSTKPLENVVLSVQLPEGATLPEDSLWTCNDSGTCVQNIGTVNPGESASAPFVFIGNNVSVGDEVSLSTRLDAQQTADDGAVTPVNLRGTVATVTVEAITQAPTGLEDMNEPTLDQKMFLPIIQSN